MAMGQTEWQWVGRETVLATHDLLLANYGGSDGVLSLDGLEGALGRPQNLAAYGEPDVADLAAAYAVGLAKAHAFVDGNKRTAWTIANAFLYLNGFSLKTADDPAAVLLMVDIADDKIDQSTVASWFRVRLVLLL
jgi:death-on-curing protein